MWCLKFWTSFYSLTVPTSFFPTKNVNVIEKTLNKELANWLLKRHELCNVLREKIFFIHTLLALFWLLNLLRRLIRRIISNMNNTSSSAILFDVFLFPEPLFLFTFIAANCGKTFLLNPLNVIYNTCLLYTSDAADE